MTPAQYKRRKEYQRLYEREKAAALRKGLKYSTKIPSNKWHKLSKKEIAELKRRKLELSRSSRRVKWRHDWYQKHGFKKDTELSPDKYKKRMEWRREYNRERRAAQKRSEKYLRRPLRNNFEEFKGTSEQHLQHLLKIVAEQKAIVKKARNHLNNNNCEKAYEDFRTASIASHHGSAQMHWVFKALELNEPLSVTFEQLQTVITDAANEIDSLEKTFDTHCKVNVINRLTN